MRFFYTRNRVKRYKTTLKVPQVADECRAQAENSRHPANKERWLKLAAERLKMAEQADEGR